MALEKGKMRVVVAGLGSIGRRHTRLLMERSDIEVEVFEPADAAMEIAVSELGQLSSHVSFEAVLDSNPDVVWLATPTQFHADQAIAALSAGCHVFCEKPMSDSVANGLRMKAAAERSGKILNIGFMLHFMPAMKRLREIIRDGLIGNIVHVHARVGTYITLINSISRYQATTPGSLFLDYAHQPDIFYWLLGKSPSSVRSFGLQAGKMELSSNPNVAVIVCEYDDDLITTLHLNYVQLPQRHDYEIVGDEGWASLDFETGEIKIALREDQLVTTEFHTYQRDTLYRDQITSFLDSVSLDGAPESSASDGLISTAVCEAAINSYSSGSETIKLSL